MKHLIINILLLFSLSAFSQTTSAFSGAYYGKNMFVVNPVSGDGFCIIEVKVNGKVYAYENTAAAFEIRLNEMGLENGAPLDVSFTHHEGCSPKILNTEVFSDHSFRINSGYMNNGILQWKADEYEDDFAYRLQQFRWNKWINVDAQVAGPDAEGFYTADLNDETHSFVNTFRIIAEDPIGIKAYSSNFSFEGIQESNLYEINQKERLLTFSYATRYELYNAEGDLVTSGDSDMIDLTGIDAGAYYMNFDNANVKIQVK